MVRGARGFWGPVSSQCPPQRPLVPFRVPIPPQRLRPPPTSPPCPSSHLSVLPTPGSPPLPMSPHAPRVPLTLYALSPDVTAVPRCHRCPQSLTAASSPPQRPHRVPHPLISPCPPHRALPHIPPWCHPRCHPSVTPGVTPVCAGVAAAAPGPGAPGVPATPGEGAAAAAAAGAQGEPAAGAGRYRDTGTGKRATRAGKRGAGRDLRGVGRG